MHKISFEAATPYRVHMHIKGDYWFENVGYRFDGSDAEEVDPLIGEVLKTEAFSLVMVNRRDKATLILSDKFIRSGGDMNKAIELAKGVFNPQAALVA